jgi:hypothetical protein
MAGPLEVTVNPMRRLTPGEEAEIAWMRQNGVLPATGPREGGLMQMIGGILSDPAGAASSAYGAVTSDPMGVVSGILGSAYEGISTPLQVYRGQKQMTDAQGRILPERIGEAFDIAGTLGSGTLAKTAVRGGQGQNVVGMMGGGEVVQKGTKKGAKKAAKSISKSDVYKAASESVPQKQSYAAFVDSELDKPGELFDYSLLDQVPPREQKPLERYVPKKLPERLERALADPRTEKALNEYVARGEELGGRRWYNTEPYRQVFDEEWGRNADQKYSDYMDVMAATSPRSRVPDNVRTQSYYWDILNDGGNGQTISQRMVELPEKPPAGYGSVAQGLHRGNVQKLMEGGMDPRKNPKPLSFSQNLQGNWDLSTIDTHNFRPLGMVTRDPDFMMRSFNPEKGRTINPRQMYDEGQISMDDALAQPTFWEAKPRENEYAGYEDWQRGQAAKMDMTPAEYQASMWIGAGDLTGLQSPPEPFLRTLERRIQYTAARLGITPQEAMRRHVRGEIPLLSVAGAGLLGAGAAGSAEGEGSEGD